MKISELPPRTMYMKHTCPSCGKVQNLASDVYGIGDARGPSDGDVSFCASCGEYSTFDKSSPGGLRLPTEKELEYIEKTPSLARIREFWAQIYRSDEDAQEDEGTADRPVQ